MPRQENNLTAIQLERLCELLFDLNSWLEKEYFVLRAPVFAKSIYEKHALEVRRNKIKKDMRDVSILQTQLKAIIKQKLCASKEMN